MPLDRRPRMFLRMFLLLPLALAGCMGVPRPAPRAVPGADAGWITPAPGPVDARWWTALADPRLDALVDDALKASPDIAEAEAHLRAARARQGGAAGAQLPAVGAGAGANRSRQSNNGLLPIARIPGLQRDNTLFDAGFDASWEIDLWGGARSATAAAAARADVVAARTAGVRLQVVAEVIRAYAALRMAQARRTAVTAQIELQAGLAALEAQRANEGEIHRDPVLAAEQRLEALRAMLPAIESRIEASAFALAVLTRRPPEAMLPLAAETGTMPHAPHAVLLGLRSELLQRRPDVRAAEADLAAYTADIGEARAALFPRITLSGALGQQARGGLSLLDGDSTRFSAGPTLSWPIFNGGALRARLRGTRAEAEAAGARYEKAVLAALADSEGASNRYARALESEARQQAARQRAAAIVELARQRADQGEDSRIELDQARIAGHDADLAAITASEDALEAWIALCKSLGGGW